MDFLDMTECNSTEIKRVRDCEVGCTIFVTRSETENKYLLGITSGNKGHIYTLICFVGLENALKCYRELLSFLSPLLDPAPEDAITVAQLFIKSYSDKVV